MHPKPSAPPAGTDPGGTSPLRNLFGIDPRSLALFRILIGAILLLDLATRASDLGAMYTDDGMFPRTVICHHYTSFWNWSFHFGSGMWQYQALLFGLAAVLALALTAGFETRFAVVGSWLMLVSLHNRVPPVLSGSDNLLRMLLFWAMFLPLGRVWSVDRRLEQRRGIAATDQCPVLSVASGAILLQMALMYLFSAIFKSNGAWLQGEAIAGTLEHDFYAKPLGAHLTQFPAALTAMTFGIFAIEWLAPLLLFSPWRTARLRPGMIAVLAAMHIGIEACLTVGLFSLVSLAGLALFLPAGLWNSRLLSRLQRGSTPANKPPVADERGMLTPSRRLPPRIAQGACTALFVYVLAININSLPGHVLARLNLERWEPFWTALGLGQKWGMFDQVPSKDGWFVARAELLDGSEVDLLRKGAAVDWKRPEFPALNYPNHRWRKCFREMAYFDELGYQMFRAPVARFLCRDWNGRHALQKQVGRFEFIYCTATTADAAQASASRILRERLVHLDFNREPLPPVRADD